MTISFTLLLSGKLSIQLMSALFIITGVCCSYQTYAIYIASTCVREGVVGLTTAVANMIIMIFGYFFHSVIGWLISVSGGIDNPQAFSYGIAVIPIALAIGGIGFILIYFEEKRQQYVFP